MAFGKWKPGQSGNPGGKAKKTEEQREFERKCRSLVNAEGWKWLEDTFKSGKFEQKKFAMEVFLDRGFGRPVQVNENENFNHSEIDDLSDDEINSKLIEHAKRIQPKGASESTGLPS